MTARFHFSGRLRGAQRGGEFSFRVRIAFGGETQILQQPVVRSASRPERTMRGVRRCEGLRPDRRRRGRSFHTMSYRPSAEKMPPVDQVVVVAQRVW